MLELIKTFGLFVTAPLCEVAGAYLIWHWQRTGKPALFTLLGTAILIIYSLIQTINVLNFGRAFAAYGGMSIVTAQLWGWLVDGHRPDRWDWVGAGICLVGVLVIITTPRS